MNPFFTNAIDASENKDFLTDFATFTIAKPAYQLTDQRGKKKPAVVLHCSVSSSIGLSIGGEVGGQRA